MGKPIGKKKPHPEASKQGDAHSKSNKHPTSNPKAFDEDTAVFITMSQELKDEGNKLFQKRDYESAMLMFEKALKLLPQTHIDVASLRTNMASCYMQMGIGEYPRAINECNLALQVAPKYSKGLLRRAKCFEALNRLDLAWRDVCLVLNMEPNNLNALEIRDSVKKKGIKLEDIEIGLDSAPEPVVVGSRNVRKPVKDKKSIKEKPKNKKRRKKEEFRIEEISERSSVVDDGVDIMDDKSKPEDKEVVQEEIKEETVVARTVKLVYGDDIRWAQLPINCSLFLMRDIVRDRFPNLQGVLIKYRDHEGDFITITTTDELRKAETYGGSEGSLRLYITEVSPDQEPLYGGIEDDVKGEKKLHDFKEKKGSTCMDVWILQFSQLFKNHVGFDSDAYLGLHEVGMRLYSEAIEDTVSTEEAQELFDIASEKFQEMAALALFNWGNVHMSKARKRVFLSDDHHSSDSVLAQIKAAYEWSKKEYMRAGMRYEESIKIKPDFYEGFLALGLQQFEQAKLCWIYAVRNKVELEEVASSEVLQLFNKAEDSMEAGMQMWEETEERRLNGLSKEEKYKPLLKKVGLGVLLNDMSSDEASDQAKIMRAQIHIVWGSLLYERSIVEFKLGLPTWEECLEVAVEKFELAGASNTDMAVMVKNHCAHQTAQGGLVFKIDEIVQAWHEMYDAKRWLLGVPSFRLEPLFRRRVPRLHQILEHV
ncbi:hypothetical protein V2J09_022951 [Rumex salicifolius]